VVEVEEEGVEEEVVVVGYLEHLHT